MRVLVTGAAGAIGRAVVPGLLDLGHQVIALDQEPAEQGAAEVPWHRADCADPRAVEAVFAAERPEAVVHLASFPGEAYLPAVLVSHVHTTAALLEAMVAHGVTRFVHASSNHAVGRTPRAEVERPGGALLTTDVPPRPDTFYGVGKVAAEALLRLYSERHGIDVVACRIGSFLPEPSSTRALSTWLSPADAVRMVQAGLTAPEPGFAVLYGISDNTRAWWDLAPGRALGYAPQDDAEEFADRVEAAEKDAAEAEYVGGSFALAQVHRPAFGHAPGAA